MFCWGRPCQDAAQGHLFPPCLDQPNNEYLINALNDINERLRVLEEKIDKMEKNNK